MIKNYIKIAWRNLLRKKRYTAIHLIGLYSGISFALMIAVFVWQESQVNKTLKNAEQQYILTSRWEDPNMGVHFTTLAPLANSLKENYPQLVANSYRWDGITSIISNGAQIFREGIKLGDENLLTMYGFKLLHGNPKTAFDHPFSVVLKAEKAIKYFGKTDVIGNTLQIQNFGGENKSFTISGVMEATSENSVLRIVNSDENGFFIGKKTASYFDRENFTDWQNPYYVSYVELQPGVHVEELRDPIKHLLETHTSLEVQKNLEVLPVQLSKYYLNKDNGAAKRMIYILSLIGLFVLLMAMINFINISISQSGSRLREIGIRKVLGGKRKQLILQFLTESIILVSIATVLACLTYSSMKSWFSELIGKELISLSQLPTAFFLIPLLLIISLGVLSGFYPALVLSSFKSIDALKGNLKKNWTNNLLRKSLVGFQYITALVVFIAAIIVAKQVNYFFEKELGYTKESIVTAAVPREWTPEGVSKMKTKRDIFQQLTAVKNVSLSYVIPDGNQGFQVSAFKYGENGNTPVTAQGLVTDESYLNTYQIKLLAGTYFERSDMNPDKVVINKKAMRNYGFTNAQDAIGMQLTVIGNDVPLTIQGVVDDFHFESMQNEIKPLMFFNVDVIPNYRYLSFKLNSGSLSKHILELEQTWQELFPDSPFEYTLMDETLANLYAQEIQFKKATNIATVLALLIALLGIFGMVALSIDKRVKEIGIRKVLGASISNIGFLFVKEFLLILIVAVFIACPIAYLLMTDWLQNYSYRISMNMQPFVIAVVLVSGLTAALIALQTLKIARTNPVKSLKTE